MYWAVPKKALRNGEANSTFVTRRSKNYFHSELFINMLHTKKTTKDVSQARGIARRDPAPPAHSRPDCHPQKLKCK